MKPCSLIHPLLIGLATLALSACSTTKTEQSDATRDSKSYYAGELTELSSANLKSWKVEGLQPPEDLWKRLRAGMKIPDLEGPLVQDSTQWYASRPQAIAVMAQRSSKYLFHIVEELERRDMPTELALLPFVESAFNPQAVSHAKAAGMWQFMPTTGTYFSLQQNMFRDDRRDVLESTRAALDYLQKLYGMFGDWHLALASYNWGEGSVSRAISKNELLGLSTSYPDLTMPQETRQYVPRFQAIKNIVRDPAAYGVVLPELGNHPYFDTVEIVRDIDVELAAQLAEITVEDFHALNPSYNGPIIFAATTPEVLLPWDNAVIFKRNLALRHDGRLASWTVWKVPRTMKVAEVAAQLAVDETLLRSVNRIPKNMSLDKGSALLVPRADNVLYDVSADIAQNGKLRLKPLVALKKTTVIARKGETPITLAKRYGVAVSDVATWNKVARNTRFKTGQKLIVYRSVVTKKKKTQRTAIKKGKNSKNVKKKVRRTLKNKAVHKNPKGSS